MVIRPATVSDASAMLAIYAPIVRETAISFELDPPGLAAFEARVSKYSAGWAWLVAELNGETLGYAYGSPHRERAAYRWSTETSAYVALGARKQGVGTRLYQALLAVLGDRGYCNAYAGVTLPNEASVALHRSVGFSPIGTFPAVGRKFNKWHDVAWFYRGLRQLPPEEEVEGEA
jgi:L-amino acid N-acyltransferase YncA